MKVGIVIPYSWSFWGGVVEHAECQARALQALGVETRTLIGHDPPGAFSRVLHPRSGRHERPPPDVIPLGRSVIVAANGSLANVVIGPSAVLRLRRALRRERFDLVHVHEPMTPAIGVAALAFFDGPVVATFHAAGHSSWRRPLRALWGPLLDRIDYRIAVSEQARRTAQAYLPGEYELIPNGVTLPSAADPGGRLNRVVFIGRQEPRKGLTVLLRAWPHVHERTGARLRVIGADPLAVRLLLTRGRVPGAGIDILGWLSDDELTSELLAARILTAPSTGQESFGMVLTRSFACATPVVASEIPGYRAVMTPETGLLVAPGDSAALAGTLVSLLEDEPRRRAFGVAARRVAQERYAWDDIARRLAEVYELVSREAPLGGAAA
jgi:phosphatidyl-myo-inositol alpha-mannosyltransferase